MKKILILLFILFYIVLFYVLNGTENPCEHLKGADYHNQAYNTCYYNYMKGL